jgi:hypothetical protein
MESNGENVIINSEDAKGSVSNMQPRMIHFVLNIFRSWDMRVHNEPFRMLGYFKLRYRRTYTIFILHLFVLNYRPEVLTAEGMK